MLGIGLKKHHPELLGAALLLVVGLLAGGVLILLADDTAAPEDTPENKPLVQKITPLRSLPESATRTQVLAEAEKEETTTPAPQPYLPPPSTNLTGRTLGQQRVPLPEGIGDVHKLYYHRPTLTLFMTVTEPNGIRGVWKLTEQGSAERVFAASPNAGEIRIDGTRDGVIYVQHNNPSRLYRSDDGLKTWEEVLKNHGMFWGIEADGSGTVYGAQHEWNSAVLYRSNDDGRTWKRWKDFHRVFPEFAVRYRDGDDRYWLRHLHDVIWDDSHGRLIVGYGDVARGAVMSEDGGETWENIWSEGFTAHVRMSGGFRYLLGPDQLHGHGIALYDAAENETREVWNPVPHGYAGYVYSMINSGGTYYAATHTESNEAEEIDVKFGVIVSPDGETWYPFLEWGPLSNNARSDIWLAEGPNIIYASVNGALYAFRPLDETWFDLNPAFPSNATP